MAPKKKEAPQKGDVRGTYGTSANVERVRARSNARAVPQPSANRTRSRGGERVRTIDPDALDGEGNRLTIAERRRLEREAFEREQAQEKKEKVGYCLV